MDRIRTLSRDEYDARLALAERIYAACFSVSLATSRLAEAEGIDRRSARRWIQAVRRRWAVLSQQAPLAVRRELVGRAMSVYVEAREAGDRKTALSALKTLADLTGAKPQVERSTVPGTTVQVLVHSEPQAQLVHVLDLEEQARALMSGEVIDAREEELPGRVG